MSLAADTQIANAPHPDAQASAGGWQALPPTPSHNYARHS
jgi:hypothetical protein